MLIKFTYTTLFSYFVFSAIAGITQNILVIGTAYLFLFLYLSSYALIGLSIANSKANELRTRNTLKKLCVLYLVVLALLALWVFSNSLNLNADRTVTTAEILIVWLVFAALAPLIYTTSKVLVADEIKKGINTQSELFTCFALLLLPLSIINISNRINRLG